MVDHCTPAMHPDKNVYGGVATAIHIISELFCLQSMDLGRLKGFPTVFE